MLRISASSSSGDGEGSEILLFLDSTLVVAVWCRAVGRAADWERAFSMQKRAIRALVGIRRDFSASPHFTELGILTLLCIVIMQVAVYVRLNPNEFMKLSDMPSYNTRNASRLAAVSCSP